MENLKGGCEFWCSELENYLQGGVLENFRLLKDEDDDYYITKTRLLKWFKGNDKIRKQSLKINLRRRDQKKKRDFLHLVSD